ncbi:NMCC_0638 family (lipo)protein [Plastoroseomonas arctica]|uniref:Uncharacterized protein n=1 Tax=Plastoroseomonas arctica TaxID=1509237 RepID=A0AAF1JZW8_9PROT|nr:hypothetical protein [Plastoroseomonas arctica]MBR0657220.1 hypothetical protein [Plastoroseomonas arctica]
MFRGLFVVMLLAGCATAPREPDAFAIERTAAGHALFVDVCVRHLGAPEALERQAEVRNLHQMGADLEGNESRPEALRLYGLANEDGRVGLGLAFSVTAQSCSVFFRDADPGLALAFTAQLALARAREGAEVTPIVRNATALAATTSGYRVQAGEAPPGVDWAFGLTIARDGLAMFHAQLTPEEGGRRAAPPPRGLLRRT